MEKYRKPMNEKEQEIYDKIYTILFDEMDKDSRIWCDKTSERLLGWILNEDWRE